MLAERQQRQDEELKRYELFKLDREMALARAAAPRFVTGSASRSSSDLETSAKPPVATADLRLPEPAERFTAEGAACFRDEEAILRLMRYPARLFRKLAEEKDSAKRVDEQGRRAARDSAAGEQGSIAEPWKGQDSSSNSVRVSRAHR